jgi:predicted nucleotidyltransferase
MRPSVALEKHRDEIRRIAESRGAANPRIFGSTARGEDVEGSDLDILVDALPGTPMLDLGGLFEDLKALLGVDISLVTPRELPPRIRSRVLAETKSI